MRGEVCIGVASLLSFIATILLIFAHVGAINHNGLSRNIYVVSVNVSGFGLALAAATGDGTPGLYNNTPESPLAEGLGLRQSYIWGFYGYCGFVNASLGRGVCSAEGNGTFGYAFTPLDVMLSDTPSQYETTAGLLVPQSSFKDSDYDKATSQAGFYLIFIGSLAAALSFILGLIRHNVTFTLALFLSGFSSLFLMIGASVWTALVRKTQWINDYEVINNVSIGINVSYGIALWLIWAAFVAMLLSIAPYFLSCYTYRGRFR